MEDLKNLMEGKAVTTHPVDVDTGRAAGFVPKTKDTVGYIVSAVVFNDKDEVLMIQESKHSCHGLWYVPAGRLEPGESLQEGVQREVLEESGLQFEPSTLISVEFGRGTWYRITFTGVVTGGKLKTLQEKDEESLQAQWMKCDDVLNRKIPIRSSDMFKLIKRGLEHRAESAVERIPCCLPCTTGHKQLLVRPLVVRREPAGSIQLLVNSRGEDHLPTTIISPSDFSLDVMNFNFLRDVYDDVKGAGPNVYGVVGLEYSGKPAGKNDGICLSVLMELNHDDVKDRTVLENHGYRWRVLENQEILTKLTKRLNKKYCVPLTSV